MSVLLPLALMMQVGTDLHPYQPSPMPLITAQRPAPRSDPPPPATDALSACLAHGRADPEEGAGFARDWLARATTPEEHAASNQCLGLISSDNADYAGAEAAFAAAAEAAPGAAAGPLLAMAGNAALAAGEAGHALGWFDRALAGKDDGDAAARGALLADRARALVALGRNDDAASALAQARALAPGDATIWLLSATLARRMHDLAAAQGYILSAAAHDPRDPAIALEAGVIAMLAGHPAAARKSWNSVLALTPAGAEADAARGYLAQLGPPAPEPPAPPAGR